MILTKRVIKKYICLFLGVVTLIFGVIGAFLPVMPTTVFLITSLWCFSQASPELERWLLNHPRFGKSLQNWRNNKVIPIKGKALAFIGMAVSCVILVNQAGINWWTVTILIAFSVVLNYLFSRPSSPNKKPNIARYKKINCIILLLSIVILLNYLNVFFR